MYGWEAGTAPFEHVGQQGKRNGRSERHYPEELAHGPKDDINGLEPLRYPGVPEHVRAPPSLWIISIQTNISSTKGRINR